jgi:uncharacterized double-CXXCG motif protein
MKFYRVDEWENPKYTGYLDAALKWGIPGIDVCPSCGGESIAVMGLEYPCVDLSSLPARDLSILEEPQQTPFSEYERLREAVRPYAPNTILEPGASFGPLIGKGSGWFAEIYRGLWIMCLRVEAMQQLSDAGIRGMQACPIQVEFTRRGIELVNLQFEINGRFHVPGRKPPCPQCGDRFLDEVPEPLSLDRATLPTHVDIFRLLDAPAYIIANERFVDAARSLHLEGATFHEMKLEG